MMRDTDDHVLDNAGWHALVGPHRGFAEGDGLARRYRPDVSVFHAAPDDDPAAWRDLGPLATDEHVVLFRATLIVPPPDWEQLFALAGHQMVLATTDVTVPELPVRDPTTGAAVTMRALTGADVAAMGSLVTLTRPGPFQPRTVELGGYVGIFHDAELVAMAGRRIHAPGYCEVSAVCTHPDARRRGYASVVTLAVAAGIRAGGDTPFLHVAETNESARVVYEQLGFETRRMVMFGAYRRTHAR